ncbi:MAG: homoserine kinase [Frankiaceae bacterium]|nr:homoserine kinase [Frankiaceae bacterium]
MAGPSFRAAPVRVRVPATAANLGPGFDAFGLALGLYDDVVARIGESGVHVDVAGEGADDVPRDRRNLVVKAMRACFDLLGGQPRGLEVVCANRIPHGRGLGSSAAAIVAGVLAARELTLGGLADADVLGLCAEIEGHPDNVAACLLGGFTLAWRSGGSVAAVRLPVHPSVAPVAFVPGSRSSTAKARRLLPDVVPHADAAVNAGRAALLVEALGRRPDLLMSATEDLLHQPYRAEAMPRSAALMASLRSAGVAAVVSGAGPAVLAFGGADVNPGRGWTAMPLPVADGAEVVAV